EVEAVAVAFLRHAMLEGLRTAGEAEDPVAAVAVRTEIARFAVGLRRIAQVVPAGIQWCGQGRGCGEGPELGRAGVEVKLACAAFAVRGEEQRAMRSDRWEYLVRRTVDGCSQVLGHGPSRSLLAAHVQVHASRSTGPVRCEVQGAPIQAEGGGDAGMAGAIVGKGHGLGPFPALLYGEEQAQTVGGALAGRDVASEADGVAARGQCCGAIVVPAAQGSFH